ncbi:hypothetical protein NPIL_355301 [Nephila pilipes]|uniref:ETS domain-containing protein n=1 Tax=Nephila pilipes TaxID=299642 RepID=A0A8X6QQM9_NEPPI|nr:hypothetical protein NPIL_355301 [Nephila pilipes]
MLSSSHIYSGENDEALIKLVEDVSMKEKYFFIERLQQILQTNLSTDVETIAGTCSPSPAYIQADCAEARRTPPPPYPFHQYASRNQISPSENLMDTASSNLLTDHEFPFNHIGTSESNGMSVPPPPPYPVARNQNHMLPPECGCMDWTPSLLPPYETSSELRSGFHPSNIEGNTNTLSCPKPTTSRVTAGYSQPLSENDAVLNHPQFVDDPVPLPPSSPSKEFLLHFNSEDLNVLPGETVKDTLMRVFAGKMKKKTTNGGTLRLWLFIIELLADPANSNIINWKGDDGTFVIVNGQEVAKRWEMIKIKSGIKTKSWEKTQSGRKNKSEENRKMNYEKLSRSLRYYYQKRFLRKVTGQFTYQFVLPHLFRFVRSNSISDPLFIQKDFKITAENINDLSFYPFISDGN